MQPRCSSAPPLPGSRPSSQPPDTLPRALVPKASLLTPARTPQSLPQGTRPGSSHRTHSQTKPCHPPWLFSYLLPPTLRRHIGEDGGSVALWTVAGGAPGGRLLGKDPWDSDACSISVFVLSGLQAGHLTSICLSVPICKTKSSCRQSGCSRWISQWVDVTHRHDGLTSTEFEKKTNTC